MSFGDNEKALRYLRRALELEPEGMDPNYFMGDFLLETGHAAAALQYLDMAEMASRRLPASSVVTGRRSEIAQAIEKAHKRLGR